MRHRKALLGIIIVFVITWTSPLTVFDSGRPVDFMDVPSLDKNASHLVSADEGIVIDWSPVVVLELPGYSIPARGSMWIQVLGAEGIAAKVISASELIADPSLIHAAPVILVDGSLGADDASHVPAALVSLLIGEDVSIVLTGRAAWLLHLLRERGPPSGTALSNSQLLATPGLEGAVYLSSPLSLSLGSTLTTEIPVPLPMDPLQTEASRIVDLTSPGSSSLAALRHESWPLDTFLLGMEDPSLLTAQGRGLVVNTIAYSLALRENPVSKSVANLQVSDGELLGGGYRNSHAATMAGMYYAVQMADRLMTGAEWTSWKNNNRAQVLSYLTDLLVDFGAESGFLSSMIDGSVGCKSTAQGLWVLSVMDLTSQFNVVEIVAYISSRQSVDGDFENHIMTSYYATEGLERAGSLGLIDTSSLETWLRSCVIDGSKTSNPDLWGSIASNPTSISPTNQYASQFVQALALLGTAHNDPGKLTSWIVTRTSIGDGSYRDTVGPSQEITLGTASALATMAAMGTLSIENRTTGLDWLAVNQLTSGGFGLNTKDSDVVGKSKESFIVSIALDLMGETSSPLNSGLKTYLSVIGTATGYELMEPIPSLMWNYWLTSAGRLNHARGIVNNTLEEKYFDYFSQWTQYPFWSNLTAIIAPEYGPNQYRTKSVWTQYFGAATAEALGIEAPSIVISDALNYITMSQFVTGHFRPAMFIGTAHMQQSVAALEALYLLDSLDSILYRSSLEAAILAEYSGGQWSTTGWTIQPFVGDQSAIDWLCTRAALRLDLIDATMAAEISSTIYSRIQYSDLYALSRDVATLALLNSSGFSIDLEGIDSAQVIGAFGPFPFADGWLSSLPQWQPVFTVGVLEMVSILGLRPILYDTPGSSLSVSIAGPVQLGSTMNLNVIANSLLPTHTLLVFAFGECVQFENVADTDTLDLPIPISSTILGLNEVYVVVQDWNHSRAFDSSTIDVQGTLQGSLSIDSTTIQSGSLINGAVTWSLSTGEGAGLTNITVRLGDPPTYNQWTYEDASPFILQVPTTDFGTDTYNLTVTLNRQHCDDLVLRYQVDIVAPVDTYILSPSLTTGSVGEMSYIDWSLRIASNGSEVASQTAILSIVNEDDHLVYSTQGVSSDGGSVFSWTPGQQGNYTYTIAFAGNGSLVGCVSSGQIHVYEDTDLVWLDSGTMTQYETVVLGILLETSGGTPLDGHIAHVTITSPTSILVDTDLTTNSTGHVSVTVTLDENGIYYLEASFAATGYLRSSSDSDMVNAWSSSYLHAGGIGGDNSVGAMWDLWAQLQDSNSIALAGESVILRVVLLPSTTVAEFTLTTNATGHVSTPWMGSTAGFYRLEAQFAGTASRGSASDSIDFALWVPVTLVISITQTPEVNTSTWIQVFAEDHLSNALDGLLVTVAIHNPMGGLELQQAGTTFDGILLIPWTPQFRGLSNVSAHSNRQLWYDSSSSNTIEGVYEAPRIDVMLPPDQIAPSVVDFIVFVLDFHGLGIDSIIVSTVITLNAQLILDVSNTTLSDGTINQLVQVGEPGTLTFTISVSAQGWLLDSLSISSDVIMGATEMVLTTPGQPIEQGTPVGIVVTLTEWSEAPLVGAQVTIEISWSNGTIVDSAVRVTGADGKCTLAHDFNEVGDFLIGAIYSGLGLNSSASESYTQRVVITPNLQLNHDPSCILGNTLQIHVGVTDTYQQSVVGRTLILSVVQNSVTVFESQIQSEHGLVIIHWDPIDRGIAAITLLHAGDPYYYTNSTSSTVSTLELVNSNLIIEPSSINLFQMVALRYEMLTAGTKSGVMIHFEVLGLDLVPLWVADIATNSSGIAEAMYLADDSQGLLTVQASPDPDQFLIGGDTQEQLNVMTTCSVSVTLTPDPPSAGREVNISLLIIDQLGIPIDGLGVTVSLHDPLGAPVKLGVWSNSISVNTISGVAFVTFNPSMTGLYSVHLSSSGAASVHGFINDSLHTIYSESILVVIVSEKELEVGDSLEIEIRLTDYQGSPMIDRTVSILLDGPGGSQHGPKIELTNSTGCISWSVQIDVEGLWAAKASFDGLGVYLPVSNSTDVSVRYGTVIQAHLIDSDAIAGDTPVSLSVLLMDSGLTPLEGFTIDYAAYHDQLGLMLESSIVQIGQEPILLNITLDRMGNYTILLSFVGTTHYQASNAALRVWVFGTTEFTIIVSSVVERSSNSHLNASVLDEVGMPIGLIELSTSLELLGPAGVIDLTGYLLFTDSVITISLTGLDVGHYSLNLAVLDSALRRGTANEVQFDVVASTSIEILHQDLSGLLGEDHEVTFTLVDSLEDIAYGATVYVSLYGPDGREIHGSPLTTKTAYTVSGIVIALSWNPSLTGNYTLSLIFEGTPYWLDTRLDLVVLIRYESFLQIEHPESMEYGQPVPLSVTASSGVFKIPDALLSIQVWRGIQLALEQTAVTSSRGGVEIVLEGLLAGNLSIEIEFSGTGNFAPATQLISLIVTPLLAVDVQPLTQVQIGMNCTLNVSYSVFGVSNDWRGGLVISISDPLDQVVDTWEFIGYPVGFALIDFQVEQQGEYQAEITISSLPAVGQMINKLTFDATSVTPTIPMDMGTTPWVGGLGLVAAMAVLVWKRIGAIVGAIPSDWES
ncbi:MAG: prenyltransferase/squalene oxidase repeat-containing protein [Candidatus Thorarchaeota archaeon]